MRIPPSFTPVPVRARRDGWTPARQRAFIATLWACGCVREACRGVGKSIEAAYKLYRRPDAASFREAWDVAVATAPARRAAALRGAAEGSTSTAAEAAPAPPSTSPLPLPGSTSAAPSGPRPLARPAFPGDPLPPFGEAALPGAEPSGAASTSADSRGACWQSSTSSSKLPSASRQLPPAPAAEAPADASEGAARRPAYALEAFLRAAAEARSRARGSGDGKGGAAGEG